MSVLRDWFRMPWWRALLLALIAFVACVGHAVATASTTAPFGPHMATYEATVDGQLTVDLGPLGTAVRDLEVTGPLGVHVTVHEIPDDFTSVDVSGTINGLAADLQRYMRFFASPQDTFSAVITGLVKDVGFTVLRDLLVLSALVLILFAAMGQARRRVNSDRLLRYSPWITVCALVLVAVIVGTATATVQWQRQVAGSEVFHDTPLEGTQVTGRLGGLLETYGVQLMNVYRSNERFYDNANTALGRAWDARMALDAVITGAIQLPSAGDDLDEGSATDGLSETGEDSSESDTTNGVAVDGDTTDRDASDLITIVVVADIHCNFSVSPLIATLAERSGAQLVLHGGDATINGTAVEQTCVDSLVHAMPADTKLVYAGGNHDSAVTADQFENAGAVVLRGATSEVAGVRILGDLDPYETRIGTGTTAAGEESGDAFAARISATACADQPDIVLIHTPYLVQDALRDNCAAYTISGHFHRRVGPVVVGGGVEYVNASTAGAVEGQPTVGPLRGTAEMTVLRFDPESRRIVDYRIVSITPSASVGITQAIPYPTPPLLGTSTQGE